MNNAKPKQIINNMQAVLAEGIPAIPLACSSVCIDGYVTENVE